MSSSKRLPQTQVVYIGGMSRSGSTLLDLLFGTAEGVFSGGEIKRLWECAILKGEPCACGRQYQDCSVWSQVLTESVLGGPPKNIAQKVVAIQKRGDVRFRHTGKISRMVRDRDLPPTVRWYRDIHVRVHLQLANITNSNTIINSSKFPQDAALLSSSPDIDLRFVHLIRDPRGVVSSLHRKKLRHDGRLMPRKSSIETAFNWSLINLGCEQVAKLLRDRAIKVRYERIATYPDETMQQLTKAFSLPSTYLNRLYAEDNHTIGGNPHRFNRTPREIKLDERWRDDLGLWDRFITQILTAPFQPRYT